MTRKGKVVLSVLLIISLLLSGFGGRLPSAKAAAAVSCAYPYYYAPYDGTVAGGTPAAYYLTITGANPNASYYLNAYFYNGSNPTGAFVWNAETASWIATTSATPVAGSSSLPVFNTDGTGSWSGWVFVKSTTTADYKVNPNFRIRCYWTANTSSTYYFTVTYYSVSMMNMGTWAPPAWVTAQGGWISGTAFLADGTTPAQGKIVVVRNSTGTIIGMYATEDNTIAEGYAATPGAFTVAVPVGTWYSVEIWDPATNVIIGKSANGISVTAGATTAGIGVNQAGAYTIPGSPADVTAIDGHGEIGITWSSPASDGGATVDGYDVYRATDAAMSSPTKVNALPVVGMSYTDGSLGAGADYWYAVTAHNAAGDGCRSKAVEGFTFNVPGPVTAVLAYGRDHQVDLNWDASYGDPQHLSNVRYNIWRGLSAGNEDTVTPVNATPVSGLSFSDTTVSNGTPYFYRITALNEVGQTGVMSGSEVQATPHALAPVIDHLAPASGVFTDNVRPTISAQYSNPGVGIDTASVKLLLDGVDVTAQAVVTDTGVTYSPAGDLSKTAHSVQLDVSNTATPPMSSQAVWTFTVGDYSIYFGGLHSHTNLSDGTGTPQQAYDSAKAAGVSFMAVTDHSNWFDGDSATVAANLAGGPSTEWANLKAIADANNTGSFVAIAGFEMTWSGGPGHINTFNTVGYETRTHTAMTLPAYYAQLAQYPQSISQLNHPGTTFGTFDDFGHWTAEADAVVNLVEVGNGEGVVHQSGYFPSYQYYQMALDKGWHVAPSNNQDTHKGNWMFSNDARTVILAPELTRDALYEAIRQKRVYATEDKDLQVTYHLNGAVMGSTLDNPSALNFHITFSDAESTDIITRISIIGNGGAVVASTSPNASAGTWDYTLPADPFNFYYVRIDQADTDVAVTAPVWTGDVVKVGVSKVEVSQDPQIVGSSVDFTATAYNNDTVELTNATVEFFKDSIVPENKLGEVSIPSIAASGVATAKISWVPLTSGTWTIFARLTTMVGGEIKTFVANTTFTAANPSEVTQVVIDGGHYNAYTTGYYAGNMKTLTAMIKEKKMMPVTTVVNHELTAADLRYARILILNDPQSKPVPPKNYTAAEIQVIKDFVDAGGALILTSRADYDEKSVAGTLAAHSAYQGNVVLEAIGSNLRLNDDEVIDDTSNGGQNYRLYFDDYTGSRYHLTSNVAAGETYSFYSGCSIVLKSGGNDADVDWLVRGHATTATLDSDLAHDAVSVAQGNVYALAAELLPGGGRVVVGGTAFFSDFETASSDNAYSNKQIISNILDWSLQKTVAETRADAGGDGVPDLFGNRVTVEGRVTAQSKAVGPNTAFFDVIYVQDVTGGLDVFGISNSAVPLGALVRVTGIVGQYEGDSQIHVLDESDDLQIIDHISVPVSPMLMSTGNAMLEASEGWLVKVQGVVTGIATTGGDNSLYINDGTGTAKVYLNGYVGDGSDNPLMLGAWDPSIMVGDVVSAVGLASQDASGHRLRVRNTAEIVRSPSSPVLSIPTAFLPAGGVDLPYTAGIAATGGTGLYSFSLASGTLPDGLALGANGIISGTPIASGHYPLFITVFDGLETAGAPFLLDVFGSHLSITSPSPLSTGLVNVPYYQVLSAVGGDGVNYSWSLNGGTLPPGLGLNLLTPSATATTAALQGTPTAAGVYAFTLKVVSNGQAVFKDFTMTIEPVGALSGLIYHYYTSLLDHAPDVPGFLYWQSEIARVQSLGIDVREGFGALARVFVASPEYLAKGASDAAYVTDLYETLFNRTPTLPEVTYWTDLMASGMSRDVTLNWFVYSSECSTFMTTTLGASVTRPENNLVNDLYRGFLNRLPDTDGFNAQLTAMRAAQASDAAAVRSTALAIATNFANGPEYTLRARTDTQFIEDCYNGILRRGALPAEIQGWVDLLTAGASRTEVLTAFVNSPEFQARVDQLIAAGPYIP